MQGTEKLPGNSNMIALLRHPWDSNMKVAKVEAPEMTNLTQAPIATQDRPSRRLIWQHITFETKYILRTFFYNVA